MSQTSIETTRDEDLVEAYLRGAKDSFPLLYQRYQKGIFMLVRGFFPNQEKAEEVFQEVFMKLLERLTSFDSSGSFKSWFYTLCRHHCIDRIRHQNRRPELPETSFRSEDNESSTPIDRAQASHSPADTQAYDRELAKNLDLALQNLPVEQRETFLLKERGGLTFEEIAQASGVSVNTVKSRMRYALDTLRRILKGKNFVKEALR